MVAISIDASQLKQVDLALREIRNGTNKAISGAINDTLAKMKTRVSRGIRDKVALKAKDVSPYIRAHRAKPQSLVGRLSAEHRRRIPLIKFSARQTKKGVTYRIDKQGGRKLIPSAFIAGGASKWVARRTTKKRKPLIFPAGVSAYGVFLKGGVRDAELKIAPAELAKALDRRTNFLLLAAAGKIKPTSAVKAVLK